MMPDKIERSAQGCRAVAYMDAWSAPITIYDERGNQIHLRGPDELEGLKFCVDQILAELRR